MTRFLIKLSGEPLNRLKPESIQPLAEQIAKIRDAGNQVAIVVGGGNIIRGQTCGFNRIAGDHMGMLATVINGLALQQHLPSRIMSSLGATELVEPYIHRNALKALDQGEIVIFVGGTGHPFFTTDTTAALRAAEIEADVLLKATKVDGVYDKDPEIHADAKRFDRLTYEEALDLNLQIMDQTAFALCRENRIPIKVFSIFSMWEGATQPNFGTRIE